MAEADSALLEDLVASSIRSELCFSELKAFNDTGTFLGKHPFIAQRDDRSSIAGLLRSDPDKYFEERKNVELNITRYSSQLNSRKTTQEQKARAAASLEKFKAELQLYREIFNEFIKQ